MELPRPFRGLFFFISHGTVAISICIVLGRSRMYHLFFCIIVSALVRNFSGWSYILLHLPLFATNPRTTKHTCMRPIYRQQRVSFRQSKTNKPQTNHVYVMTRYCMPLVLSRSPSFEVVPIDHDMKTQLAKTKAMLGAAGQLDKIMRGRYG